MMPPPPVRRGCTACEFGCIPRGSATDDNGWERHTGESMPAVPSRAPLCQSRVMNVGPDARSRSRPMGITDSKRIPRGCRECVPTPPRSRHRRGHVGGPAGRRAQTRQCRHERRRRLHGCLPRRSRAGYPPILLSHVLQPGSGPCLPHAATSCRSAVGLKDPQL